MESSTQEEQMVVDNACKVLGVTTGDAWWAVEAKYRQLAQDYVKADRYSDPGAYLMERVRFVDVELAYRTLEYRKDAFSDALPEPEWIRIETITAYIKYESAKYEGLMAYLEIDIEDAGQLRWYPVPEHARLSEVRVVRDGVVVTKVVIYPFEDDASYFRQYFRDWQAAQLRAEVSTELDSRKAVAEAALLEMMDLGRPVVQLSNLLSMARNEHAKLSSRYRPSEPRDVRKLYDKVDAEIERIKPGGPGIIIDDLLEGVYFHGDVTANQAVIDTVRSWHIRTNGFIDLIDEQVLRAFYERRITSERIKDLQLTGLRLKLEDFVLEELIEDLDVVAPATIELEASKGTSAYPLSYDYFERDGQKVPVATVILPLRVYEHNAPEYGKPSKFPALPFGIELRVKILFEGHVVFAGTPGEELAKKITKHNRSRNRSKALQGVGDDYGSGRYQPIEASPLPSWFQGKRPRW